MFRSEGNKTAKTKFPQVYSVQQQLAAGKMPVLTRDHLALKLRQNWMAKYPLDTCSNGGSNLDDSLTSLNWLQNLNILKITTPTPPSSPVPTQNDLNIKSVKVNPNSVLNVACGPPPTKMNGEVRFPPADTPPLTPTSLGGESVDYKTNPYVKPPYSYATLICMAMKETKKSKITLSAIYNWITDNFMYYRLADPSWQNSIRHNLSLNKCFQKVPRRKDEPGKGGFWRINPEYNDMIENGVFKKRRNSRDANPPMPPMKKIKREADDTDRSLDRYLHSGNSVVHFGAHEHDEESLRGDFNWTSILNQDIEIGGIRIKTEDLIDTNDTNDSDVASPITAMSPPSSDENSSDFGIDELFANTDFSDVPLDFTTKSPLDLSVVGQGIKPPDWWADSFNLGESRGLLQHYEHHRSGLNTPIAPSPAHEGDDDQQDAHPWSDRTDLNDVVDAAFDVDNLFDIENIPSPAL